MKRTSYQGLGALLVTGLVAAGLGACKNNADTAQAMHDRDSSAAMHTPASTGATGTAADTAHLVDNNKAPNAGTPDAAPGTAVAPAISDANILAAMGMADSGEVVEGKLAMKMGKSADVRKLGKMMIDDHTKMMKEGKALAAKLNIVPAPAPNDNTKARAGADLKRLASAAGAGFDAEYVSLVVEDHHKVLVKLNQMKPTSEELKAMIAKAIPVVQMHLDQAQEVQTKLSAKRAGR